MKINEAEKEQSDVLFDSKNRKQRYKKIRKIKDSTNTGWSLVKSVTC